MAQRKRPTRQKKAKQAAKSKAHLKFRTKGSLGTDSVADAWRRLEAWFEKHLPAALDLLNPPATLKAIRDVEKAFGQKLPEPVRESYRIHNGQKDAEPGVIFGMPLWPLERSLNNWRVYTDIFQSRRSQRGAAEHTSCFPAGFVEPRYFDRGWLSVSDDSGGNHIAIDLSPGPKGTRGQVIIFGRDAIRFDGKEGGTFVHRTCSPVLALDWAQFLSDVATECERGNYVTEEQESQGEPHRVFNLAWPKQRLFLAVGVNWSRAKLGCENYPTKTRHFGCATGSSRHSNEIGLPPATDHRPIGAMKQTMCETACLSE